MTPATIKVNGKRTTRKPSKPHDDFPLFQHATGRWAKKVNGKFAYFGKVSDDPKGERAIEKWLRDKDELLAGRKPRGDRKGLTVRALCNQFLNAKRHQLDTSELSARMFADWFAACDFIIGEFGKSRFVDDLGPADFEALRRKLAKRYGPHRLGSTVGRVRGVFKYAFEARLIDRPTHFGPDFAKPSKKTMRLHRAKAGLKMFESAELRRIIDAAGVPLKAMILLGVNAGYGNSDIANLPLAAIDLAGGWATFHRPKTGISRRAKLWPETIKALKAAIADRPTPRKPDAQALLFVTCRGSRWGASSIVDIPVEDETAPADSAANTMLEATSTDKKPTKPKLKSDDPIAKEFHKLLAKLGLHRDGLGFYCLRHTFETIAGGSRDQVAVDHIMGHADASMASVYRERIDDDRLVAVANHVRAWLPEAKREKIARRKAAV